MRFVGLIALAAATLLVGLASAQPPKTPTAPPRGYKTLWMPLKGQSHATGARSASGELRWITTWAAENKKGSLAVTEQLAHLPKGSYRAIFEVYYKVGKGNVLGSIRAWSGDKIVAEKEVRGEDYPNHLDGGYQRCFLDLNVPAAGYRNFRLELYYANNHYVWLGAIALHVKGRPFYLMAHRVNNAAKVNAAVNEGANGVEVDIHPYGVDAISAAGKSIVGKKGKLPQNAPLYEFYGYHYGDINYTTPEKFDALLATIAGHVRSGKVQVFILDCKQTFVTAAGLPPWGSADLTKYGKSLAAKLKKAGIPANRLMLSVPAANAKALRKALADNGFAVALDAYVESGGSGKETDWESINKWAEGVVKEEASFQGVGLDESVRGPFYRYAYRLQDMIARRDSGSSIKKVWFWTVNNAKETRQLLDYGVDGILTDSLQTIKDVMKEPAYKGVYRLADSTDRLDTVHHAGTARAATPRVVARPVAGNSRFVLSGDGKFFSQYYSGKSYYYPQVLADRPEVLMFGGGAAPLKYGDRLKVLTTNTAGWTAKWRAYNQLGTFNDGVYYYKYDNDNRVVWKIVSAEGREEGETVADGDVIRLLNVAHNQYLYRKGNITSTKSGDDSETAWTIRVR